VDLSDLKDILRMLEEQEITEFELEQDGVKLRVCRSRGAAATPAPAPAAQVVVSPAAPAAGTPVAGAMPPPAEAPAPPAEDAGSGETAGEPGEEEGTLVPSPIVGTFYRSPDPNSDPFVKVGDQVRVGQVLCIVEAMKLMNEIEAEVAGEILKVHAENGQPVQYGDPLFTIRPA
jgi:acetyl-CoA carboxylase biotin carboxyl carrier protein